MTTDLGESLCSALATHILAKLVAVLPDSAVVTEWPEPSGPSLELSPTRVVVAVTRGQKAQESTRIGDPTIRSVVLTTTPTGTVQYDHGEFIQPLQLGVWAWSKAMRNDVDRVITLACWQPYWTTVSPVASTTLSVATTKLGDQWITPVAMTGIFPGTTLKIGSEHVSVLDLRAGKFRAVLKATHAVATTITEVASRRNSAANELYLRMADQYSQVARYAFEAAQSLDGDGVAAQRQEWRSLREGLGCVMDIQEVTGVVLRKNLIASMTAATTTVV